MSKADLATRLSEYQTLKYLIVLLISFIVANPFILFLLSNSILISLFIYFAVSILNIIVYYKLKKRLLLAYMFNFLALISIFIHFEVIFRYSFADYIIENLYQIHSDYIFNKAFLNSNLEDKEYKVTYRTNAQGLRIGAAMDVHEKIGRCDWLFVGDSFTQGAQVEFEELYTTQLYRYFPDKIIVNAGVSGLGIPDEYFLIKDQIQRLNPKFVFLQLCNFNDFMNVVPQSTSLLDNIMEYSDLLRSILYSWKYKSPDELTLGRWTEPFYKTEKDNAEYNIFYKQFSDRKNFDLNNFRRYLNNIQEIVKQNNAELVVFLIPTKEQIYYKYFEEVITEYNIDPSKLDMNYPNRFLKQLTDSLSIAFLDLTDFYSTYQQQVFFEYDEHLNEFGHMATAEALYGFLREKYRIKSPKLISSSLYGDRYPEITKDGSIITFQSFRHTSMELFMADSIMENQKRLTYNDVDESHPTLSPDQRYLAYTQGDQSLGKSEVVLQNLSTGAKHILTEGKSEYGAIAKFSSDGKYLVFPRWFLNETGVPTNPEIIVYDMKEGNKEILIAGYYENWRPVFSPDNSSIVFISKRQGNFDLFQYVISSHQEIQLTHSSYDEWDPNWFSDGASLIYAAKINGNWDLCLLNLYTKQFKQLTFSLGDEWDPCFNGNKVLFAGKFGFMGGIYELSFPEM